MDDMYLFNLTIQNPSVLTAPSIKCSPWYWTCSEWCWTSRAVMYSERLYAQPCLTIFVGSQPALGKCFIPSVYTNTHRKTCSTIQKSYVQILLIEYMWSKLHPIKIRNSISKKIIHKHGFINSYSETVLNWIVSIRLPYTVLDI